MQKKQEKQSSESKSENPKEHKTGIIRNRRGGSWYDPSRKVRSTFLKGFSSSSVRMQWAVSDVSLPRKLMLIFNWFRESLSRLNQSCGNNVSPRGQELHMIRKRMSYGQTGIFDVYHHVTMAGVVGPTSCHKSIGMDNSL